VLLFKQDRPHERKFEYLSWGWVPQVNVWGCRCTVTFQRPLVLRRTFRITTQFKTVAVASTDAVTYIERCSSPPLPLQRFQPTPDFRIECALTWPNLATSLLGKWTNPRMGPCVYVGQWQWVRGGASETWQQRPGVLLVMAGVKSNLVWKCNRWYNWIVPVTLLEF
jgi:hypothetical protein